LAEIAKHAAQEAEALRVKDFFGRTVEGSASPEIEAGFVYLADLERIVKATSYVALVSRWPSFLRVSCSIPPPENDQVLDVRLQDPLFAAGYKHQPNR
jgi:hypothetical protein